MKASTKKMISAGAAIPALCAVAGPAAASQYSYNFNVNTPAWQQPVAVGRDAKTVTNHYAVIYFSSIKAGDKATAEICSYTINGVDCSGSVEQTDLTTGANYHIPANLPAGADTFFRLRTNTVTTVQVSMLGNSTTF